jgi:hypothetical protein
VVSLDNERREKILFLLLTSYPAVKTGELKERSCSHHLLKRKTTAKNVFSPSFFRKKHFYAGVYHRVL